MPVSYKLLSPCVQPYVSTAPTTVVMTTDKSTWIHHHPPKSAYEKVLFLVPPGLLVWKVYNDKETLLEHTQKSHQPFLLISANQPSISSLVLPFPEWWLLHSWRSTQQSCRVLPFRLAPLT